MKKESYSKKVNTVCKYAVVDEANNIIEKFRLKNTADNSIGRIKVELGFNIKLKIIVIKNGIV